MAQISTKFTLFPQKFSLQTPLRSRQSGVSFNSTEEQSSRRREWTRAIGELEAEFARAPGKDLQRNRKRNPQGSKKDLRNENRERGLEGEPATELRKSIGDDPRKGIGEEARKGIQNETHSRTRETEMPGMEQGSSYSEM
jgi:hypothetical protein